LLQETKMSEYQGNGVESSFIPTAASALPSYPMIVLCLSVSEGRQTEAGPGCKLSTCMFLLSLALLCCVCLLSFYLLAVNKLVSFLSSYLDWISAWE
jgi:hypothetical protein